MNNISPVEITQILNKAVSAMATLMPLVYNELRAWAGGYSRAQPESIRSNQRFWCMNRIRFSNGSVNLYMPLVIDM